MNSEIKENKNELNEYQEKTFEEIKHIDKLGNEYWEARELMTTVGYKSWRYFEDVINKAKLSCKLSNNKIEDHFVVDNKIVIAGASKKPVTDYKLSRYACYLIVQNGNPRNKNIALGQTYFAFQTRKQEVTEEYLKNLNENEKRLATRKQVTDKNKLLYATARKAGVENYGKFTNRGYMGLYGGERAEDIAKRKGINYQKQEILDYMDSTELAANWFRITQTDEKLKNDKVNNEEDACDTHELVGAVIRQTMARLGNTMPEDLPTPEKSIKEIEKEELQKIETK